MSSFLLFSGVVAVCGLMLWASYKMEPHWVSKDGERMICYGQCLSRGGRSVGRWRELRISRIRPDTLEVRPRRGSLTAEIPGTRSAGSIAGGLVRRRGPKTSYWKVAGKTETPLRNRVMYILDGNTDANLPDLIAIRLPSKSKAIPMLEAMAAGGATVGTGPVTATQPERPTLTRPAGRSRGTDRSAAQPDPG